MAENYNYGSILNEICKIVRKCGDIMLKAERTPEMVRTKEGKGNFVTTYDNRNQEILKTELMKLIPEANFVGEESDLNPDISKGYAFIVDPIDGTSNFIRDSKCSCISVAVALDNRTVIGVIFNPYLDEMFTAIEGRGAFLNGEPIHVSNLELKDGIILIGSSPYYKDMAKKTFDTAYDYFQKGLDIRRSGSAAMDFCTIAAGRAELFFEYILSPWDYAAGMLIVKEAGGFTTGIDGSPVIYGAPSSILATNAIIHNS